MRNKGRKDGGSRMEDVGSEKEGKRGVRMEEMGRRE